jgi:hypothetical protein
MTIINLTPHELNVIRIDGTTLTLAPSGTIARIAESRVHVDTINSIGVTKVTYGQIEGLPGPQAGVLYIVSALVAQVASRVDVLSPGPLSRGQNGQPVGCQGLTAWV